MKTLPKVGVADADGFVTSAQYYAGAVKLGTSTNGPFILSATNTPVGKLVLTAVAKDNLDLTSTVPPVHVAVIRVVLAR